MDKFKVLPPPKSLQKGTTKTKNKQTEKHEEGRPCWSGYGRPNRLRVTSCFWPMVRHGCGAVCPESPLKTTSTFKSPGPSTSDTDFFSYLPCTLFRVCTFIRCVCSCCFCRSKQGCEPPQAHLVGRSYQPPAELPVSPTVTRPPSSRAKMRIPSGHRSELRCNPGCLGAGQCCRHHLRGSAQCHQEPHCGYPCGAHPTHHGWGRRVNEKRSTAPTCTTAGAPGSPSPVFRESTTPERFAPPPTWSSCCPAYRQQ
jgi:hypothetical protein